MNIKIVTDSTSDIPPDVAQKLGIVVVPVYVRFGDTIYLDGVEISNEEFYQKLITSPVHPATSQPSPADFARTYSEHIKNSGGIVSIHISSKLSGTYNSAILAKDMLDDSHLIEVIDSKFNSAGLGLVAIAAARLASSGASLSEVVEETHRAIAQVRMFGMFGTLVYLARSGRANKAIATVSRILHVMPLLTFRDGEIVRAGLVRTVTRGIDRIYDFVKKNTPVHELTIVHSVVADQANQLKQRLSEFIPEERISIAELGAALGVHGGPGVLLAALRRSEIEQ
jgi:DegV family protein with EDD domain